MTIPEEYRGREQTYLKHQVLRKYLSRWGYKLASAGRHQHHRLWYVDCFAGPWKSRSARIDDTSVSIGLAVLNEVLEEWQGRGARVSAEAVFVEADPKSFDALKEHVDEHAGAVRAHVLPGEFGSNVEEIRRLLGDDAAFVFVDPTGWKGVGMRHIARLVDRPFRDVMINVMYEHINRFKAEERRTWLREQLCDFFGIEDNAQLRDLDEEALLRAYRNQLKTMSGLRYALELAVPHPTQDRTYFHLVAGGRHRDVVSLFRDVEAAVVGGEAAEVRESARRRKDEASSGQLGFDLGGAATEDLRYRRLRDDGLEAAREIVLEELGRGVQRFEDLWPHVLEGAHITRSNLGSLIKKMRDESLLIIEGMGPRERTIKDEHTLRL